MIKAENVTFEYDRLDEEGNIESKLTAVDHLSLKIESGSFIAVLGHNGSGKSTLLKLICGILKPYKGTVTINGSIAPLIELGAGFDGDLTARENIFLNGAVLGYDQKFMEQHFDEIVNFAELWDFLDMPIKNYSSGMAARLGFAIATIIRPDILICDEPTTALDVTVQAQILALIKELQKEYGFTTIFITHDLGVVAGVADRIGVMYGGQIVEYGTDEDIFYRAAHPYTWALLSSLPQLAVEGEPLTYIRGNPPAFDQEIDGDAFAPRSEYAMKIDYIMEPPMTQISETHYAKTWLLDKRAPKVKKPAVIRNLEERMKKTAESFLASSNGGESHE